MRRRPHLIGWIAAAVFLGIAATWGATSQAQTDSVKVTSDINPSSWLQPVTFTATVYPSTATGTVTFRDSVAFLGQVTLAGGTAQLVKANLFTGAHTAITARYNGDGTHPALTSGLYTQVVYQAPSTTSLATDVNPSYFGQTVKLTGTTNPGATGRMQYYDGANLIGTAAINSSGHAVLNASNFLPGTHTLTAQFPGDNGFMPSTSGPVDQVVTKVPSTATLSFSQSPAGCGQAVTLTASIVPSDADGDVQFTVNGFNYLSPAPVVGGVASIQFTPFSATSVNLCANYGGNAVYLPSSACNPLPVTKSATTIALNSDINPSFYQQSVKLIASVTPSQASGTVTFRDSSTFLGTAVISNGVATFTTSNPNPITPTLFAGKHTALTASYAGDGCYLGSTSPPYSQQVNTSPIALGLSTDINPAVFGQNIRVTATIVPIGCTGTVQFFSDGNPIGTKQVNSLTGLAVLPFSTLLPGGRTLTAVYVGDRNHTGGTTPPYSQVIEHETTITDLSSNGNPSPLGQGVDLIANVSPSIVGSGLPTGSVQFSEGATVLGTAPIDEGSGVALVTVNNLTVGTHHFCATYSGNGFYATSTGCFDQIVTPSAGLRQQAAGMVTKLTAETIESAVRVSWAGSAAGFASLELQRASSVAGPWRAVNAVRSEDAGRSVADDRQVEAGRTYFYRLLGTTTGGLQTVYGPVEGTAAAPKAFALAGAWPNPSRGSMTMAITVPRASNVRLSVLDLQGREVAVLADGVYSAGRHEMRWDGRTDHGVAASGLYFIRYVTPEQKFLSRVAIAR